MRLRSIRTTPIAANGIWMHRVAATRRNRRVLRSRRMRKMRSKQKTKGSGVGFFEIDRSKAKQQDRLTSANLEKSQPRPRRMPRTAQCSPNAIASGFVCDSRDVPSTVVLRRISLLLPYSQLFWLCATGSASAYRRPTHERHCQSQWHPQCELLQNITSGAGIRGLGYDFWKLAMAAVTANESKGSANFEKS